MSRWRAVMLAALLALGLSLPAGAQSRRGELRGAWMGEGYGRDYTAIMESLKENGFNAFFPNFSIGDTAFYPSKVLTAAPGGEPGRDELAEAAKAAKERAVELHVWRINWALWRTPPEALDELDAAGRLQRNSRGQRGRADPDVGVDWLCPSHRENRKLEKEAMLELVRSYDIAGIQFDYMRFPNGNYCFCEGCRRQFEEDSGVRVERWPDEVLEGGARLQQWLEWRRGLQTSLVKEISRETRRIKPDVSISLAAWPDLAAAQAAVGQEWPAWVRQGMLDFVCPMDYTVEREELSQKLAAQLAVTRGAVPLYAGLGAFMMESGRTLIEQVAASREAGADGFVAFAYGSGDLAGWLPQLRATVAATDPNPMPHRGPPARFGFSGPAVAEPAGKGQVVSGAELELEIAVGRRPPSPGPTEEQSEGAAQAGSMLERATETRRPITSYESMPVLPSEPEEEERISGRIVVETPSGMTTLPLGAFDTGSWLEKTIRFPAPEGAFRVAVYGSLQAGENEVRDFVVRGPVLTGMNEEELRAVAGRAEMDRLCDHACDRFEAQGAADLTATLQIEATGPGGGHWWLRFEGGKCESGAGTVENPDLTLTASVADFLAIARGESRARTMWEAGRLKVSGDQALLGRLAELFPDI